MVYFSLMPVGWGFYRDFIIVLTLKLFPLKIIYHLHNLGIQKKSKNVFIRWMYKMTFRNSVIIHLSKNVLSAEFRNLKIKNSKSHVQPRISPVA